MSNNKSKDDAALIETQSKVDFLFNMLWLISLLLLSFQLSSILGPGNYNWFQKSFFLLAGILFVLKNPLANKVVINGFIIIILSITTFAALTNFLDFSWARTANATIALISILIFYLVVPKEKERFFMLKTLAALTPAIIISGFILLMLIGRPIFGHDHTGASRYAGGSIPAFLAAAAYASTIAYSMLFRYTKENKYLILAFGCLFTSLLTGSRMATVCATVCLFTLIFTAIKGGALRIAFIFAGVTAVAIGLLTFGQQIIIRFSSESSSGRDLLWNSVLAWAEKYPWTGIGFGHHSLVIPEFVQKITGTQATHNEYVRLAGELGYIGAITFSIGIFMMYYFAPNKKNISDIIVTLIVLSTFALFSYSDNTLSSSYCMLAPLAYVLGSGLKNKTD